MTSGMLNSSSSNMSGMPGAKRGFTVVLGGAEEALEVSGFSILNLFDSARPYFT